MLVTLNKKTKTVTIKMKINIVDRGSEKNLEVFTSGGFADTGIKLKIPNLGPNVSRKLRISVNGLVTK